MIVGFSYNNGIVSKIIRKMTRSECSHCYIYDKEHGLVFHAQGASVKALSYENFKHKNTIVWETPATSIDWDWTIAQLGKSYGFLTLVGFCIPLLFNKKNPFNDSDYTLICSELVAKSMGIANAEKVRPDQLLSHLRDGKPLT